MTATGRVPPDFRSDRLLAGLGLDGHMLRDYQQFLGVLGDVPSVPQRVLSLCRARVAAVHGMTPDPTGDGLDAAEIDALKRGELDGFSESERAALGLVECLCLQPHAMTDADVADCVASFGGKGAVGLMTAIAFADVDCRLRLTLPTPAETPPATSGGA